MKSRNPICGCLVRLGASRSEGASCGGPLDPRACLGCPASVSPGRLTPPPPRACALARPQMATRGMRWASSGVSKHTGLAPALPAAAGQVPATEANPRSGGGWEHAETQDRTGDLQIFGLTPSQLSYRGCGMTGSGPCSSSDPTLHRLRPCPPTRKLHVAAKREHGFSFRM